MSYTEIYAFDKEGNAYRYGDVHNSFRGAMTVWKELEKKYLPSLPKPEWARVMNEPNRYWSRLSICFGDEVELKKVWNLNRTHNPTASEEIVLLSTMDNAIVFKKDFRSLIKAFLDVDFDSNLPEQAAIIKDAMSDEGVVAIGWNQTSVNGDTWDSGEKYELDEFDEKVYIPYNIFKEDQHYNIFENIHSTSSQSTNSPSSTSE